jgi:putative transposase
MTKSTGPFRWFDSSPEVIRLVVLMYVKYRLCQPKVQALLTGAP